MTSPCDLVTERLALGEPLGTDGDAHVAACPACARLVRVPGLVAAAARPVETPIGFAARMQVGARAALAARRRNRILATTGTAAAVAAAVMLVVTRPAAGPMPGAMRAFTETTPITSHAPTEERPAAPIKAHAPDALELRLVRLADVAGALEPSPQWDRAEAPLTPYRNLLDRQGAHR